MTSPDRYQWPAASEEELAISCSRIARHLSRTNARIIGLLPVSGPLAATDSLAPVLSRLARALGGFVAGDIAIIDGWRTWSLDVEGGTTGQGEGGGASAADAETQRPAGKSRFREIHPHVLEVAPPPCADATAAAAALQSTVGVLRQGVALVLIHLGGYAPADVAPSSLLLVDGVVMLVTRRRTRQSAVGTLLKHVAPAKRLGAILIG
jgi:hypothetical protein